MRALLSLVGRFGVTHLPLCLSDSFLLGFVAYGRRSRGGCRLEVRCSVSNDGSVIVGLPKVHQLI